MAKRRIPQHVGFIPDGNRRWASAHGLEKHAGYGHGVAPGSHLLEQCKTAGIEEAAVYCFTKDNMKRASLQSDAFKQASLIFAREVIARGAAVLIVGDPTGSHFPSELAEFQTRKGEGIKVNLLMNYDWEWDLNGLKTGSIRSRQFRASASSSAGEGGAG